MIYWQNLAFFRLPGNLNNWEYVTTENDLLVGIRGFSFRKSWHIYMRSWKKVFSKLYVYVHNRSLNLEINSNGPGVYYIEAIFLNRFRLYILSFMFRFMFANICFEKNQNSKIRVMFIEKITWNETWNNQLLPFANMLCMNMTWILTAI